MQIRIASRKVILSRSLRALIHQQLAVRLQRFAAAIVAATVELSDRNGRRGGGDKRCRIQLTLARGGRIVADDIRANVLSAFSHAISRAQSAAHRQLRLATA